MVPAKRRLGETSTRGLEGISSLFDRSVKVSRFATNSQQIFKAVELQLQFLAGAAPILDEQVGVHGALARTMRRSTAALKSSLGFGQKASGLARPSRVSGHPTEDGLRSRASLWRLPRGSISGSFA